MKLSVDEALQKGIEAHKEGQVREADKFYTAILQSHPKHPDANHNMGLLAVGIGKVHEALPFFKTALEANQSIVQFWLSYIDALIALGKVSDARVAFDQAKDNRAKDEVFDLLEQRLSALAPTENGAKALKNDVSNSSQPKDPLQNQLQPLINLYSQGQLQPALDQATEMLKQFPRSATLYNICGAANAGLRQFDAAIESYKQALKTKPDYAEVYNNMGNVLRDEGNLDAAIESYKKALKIKPGYAESYYNMGLTLKDKGEVDEAIDSYKQALKIKPYYAEAYYNMGIALNEMGNSEAAIDSYTQALKIKPDCIEYAVNLIETLTSYIPVREGLSHPIISTNREIRKIDPGHDFAEIISDDFIFSLYSDYVKIISAHKLEINYPLSQIYRRNSIGRNCERHMDIFSNHNIIPKFCFGCYKVQIEPRTVIELIRLFLLFDDLDLENNNTRKCLIELRPEISGFYKGLIYCSNLNEANQIVEKLDGILGKKLGPGLFAKIKRGCSEYPLSFPQYKVINNLGNHMMGYNPDWISVEEKYDTDHPINTTLKRIPSLNGLSLSDFLVIQNWLAYARGIGDKSADLITESPVFPMDILNMATARAEIHNFVN